MVEPVVDLLRRAAEKRLAGAPPERRERRQIHDERMKRLQEIGVRRGPNAPKDGTFGGKPSNG